MLEEVRQEVKLLTDAFPLLQESCMMDLYLKRLSFTNLLQMILELILSDKCLTITP